MTLPYKPPQRIKTKLRCKFSMPGRKYNCRNIGMFLLNGKGYCAMHYDTAWRVLNPEFGQAHDWHRHVNKFTGEAYPYDTCRRCTAIRYHEGLPQSPCRGKIPIIVLRGAA